MRIRLALLAATLCALAMAGGTQVGAAPSPGTKIIFHGTDTIREIGANGGGARTLDHEVGGSGAVGPRIADVAVPDSGRRIVAVWGRNRDVGRSLVLISKILLFRPDGSGRDVRFGPFADKPIRTVAISRDGRFIAFDRSGDLYTARTARGGMRRILGSHIQAPAFSPDGQKIAFEQNTSGDQDIWIVNRDGTGLHRLTDQPGDETDPAFSPDGRLIAYSSDIRSEGLRLMRADGSGKRSLIPTGTGELAHPDFSPGGGSLVYLGQHNGRFRFFTIRIDGTKRRLVSARVGGKGPQWVRR